MSIRFNNYRSGFRIAAIAFEPEVRQTMLENDLSVLYVDSNRVVLFPEKIVLSEDAEQIEKIRKYNNYDVAEIWQNGVMLRRYNDKSDDNYFFITGVCNSNCIMCPSPEASRKKASEIDIESLMELARHIPSDTPHLTITGGEPFIVGESLFLFIDYLKRKFVNTEFLFLTNGRIFSIDKYLNMFIETVPAHSIVAVPVHGSCSAVHDTISRAKNSFEQTRIGIKNLIKNHIPVEIRLVINKLNFDDFSNIAKLIIDEFRGIEYVSIIAMEMTGNARANKDIIWITYKEAFASVKKAIELLVRSGIDVKLYNFPLCCVESSYWTLCEKSISPEKVRYAEECDDCIYKMNCGGVFAGTYPFEKDELKAIR